MLDIVFRGVGRGVEQTDEVVTPGPRPISRVHTGLDGCNVCGKVGGEVDTGLVNTEPGARPPADEAVIHHDLALLPASAHADTQSPGEVLEDVAIEAAVELLLSHGQDVIEDILPGLGVEGALEAGAVVAPHHHLGVLVLGVGGGGSRLVNHLLHDVVQAEVVGEVPDVLVRLQQLLGRLERALLLDRRWAGRGGLDWSVLHLLHHPLLRPGSGRQSLALVGLVPHDVVLDLPGLGLLLVGPIVRPLCWLLGRLLRSVLVLGDLDRLLALVVGVTGDVLYEGVDKRVLIQGLGTYHHVGLRVAIFTSHRVGHLNKENENDKTKRRTIKEVKFTFC